MVGFDRLRDRAQAAREKVSDARERAGDARDQVQSAREELEAELDEFSTASAGGGQRVNYNTNQDVFDTRQAARQRAQELGISGSHKLDNGQYGPGSSRDAYQRAVGRIVEEIKAGERGRDVLPDQSTAPGISFDGLGLAADGDRDAVGFDDVGLSDDGELGIVDPENDGGGIGIVEEENDELGLSDDIGVLDTDDDSDDDILSGGDLL